MRRRGAAAARRPLPLRATIPFRHQRHTADGWGRPGINATAWVMVRYSSGELWLFSMRCMRTMTETAARGRGDTLARVANRSGARGRRARVIGGAQRVPAPRAGRWAGDAGPWYAARCKRAPRPLQYIPFFPAGRPRFPSRHSRGPTRAGIAVPDGRYRPSRDGTPWNPARVVCARHWASVQMGNHKWETPTDPARRRSGAPPPGSVRISARCSLSIPVVRTSGGPGSAT